METHPAVAAGSYKAIQSAHHMKPAAEVRGALAPAKRRGAVLAAVFAVTGTFVLDALLFHTNLYPSILDPDSSTGLFELILRREQNAQASEGPNVVVTLGNSRLAFSPKVLDQRGLNTPYRLRTAGIAGSDPRVWYYMLRDLDPTRRRYRAVALAVDDYDDEDRGGNPADDVRDLHYVIARLRFADALTFARSFDDPHLRLEAFRGAILKGIVFQDDIRAFLSHPLHRIQYVQLCDRGYAGWAYDFLETTRDMVGLQIDWATLKVTFPPGADDDQRGTVNSFLAHQRDEQSGRLVAYRRAWIGRTLDLYRGSDTKVIFFRLPRGPIPRPDGLSVKLTGSIREFASRPNVILADEHAFESLEHPEFFKDGMHLNREGITRFSILLEREIRRLLGPPAQTAAAR
jgi:hypothetical protein